MRRFLAKYGIPLGEDASTMLYLGEQVVLPLGVYTNDQIAIYYEDLAMSKGEECDIIMVFNRGTAGEGTATDGHPCRLHSRTHARR